MAAPSMEKLDEEYASKGIRSIFLYTREAHPGENYGNHTSFEQKLEYARAFRDRFDIRRTILVDDLEGTAHHAYGLLPNMMYLLTRGGTVFFRADWTDVDAARLAMGQLLRLQAMRTEGARLAPFYTEIQGYRVIDRDGFMEGLRRNGPHAVEDFRRELPEFRGQAPN